MPLFHIEKTVDNPGQLELVEDIGFDGEPYL